MRFRTLHCTHLSHGVVFVILLTGCWQEIEYTGPDPSTVALSQPSATSTTETAKASTEPSPPIASSNVSDSATTDSNDSSASEFGEDLADSIVEPPPSAPLEESTAAATNEAPPAVEEQPAVEESPPFDDPPPATSSPPVVAETPTDERYPPTADAAPVEPAPDTSAISTPLETSSGPQSANTRRAAWTLGSRFSFAALANDRGVPAERVHIWFDDARKAAETLGLTLPELPEADAASTGGEPSRQVLNYLFLEGQQLGRDLASHHGADHAALFEVAVKSNILLVLYQPGSPATTAITTAIGEAGQRAELPAELYRPLVDSLTSGASLADIQTAVQRLHADVDQHLAAAAQPVEQSGR